MEEEDGRPGPGARQSGPADVLMDALVGSLRHPTRQPDQLQRQIPSLICAQFAQAQRIQDQRTKEKSYENVPGK